MTDPTPTDTAGIHQNADGHWRHDGCSGYVIFDDDDDGWRCGECDGTGPTDTDSTGKYGHCPECAFSAGHAARCSRNSTVPSDTVPLNPTALGIIQEFWGAEVDMHPVYGSTSGCSGGIGGSAITEHCAHICTSYKHDKARERYEAAKLALWHLMNGTEPTDV